MSPFGKQRMKCTENVIVAGLFFVGQVFVLQTEISLQEWLLNFSVLAGAQFSLSIKTSKNL